MVLSTNNSNAVGSDSFLTKLSTLREFVRGMGVTSSENELSHALRNSGYNVELALERLLSGCFKEVGDSNGNVAAISTPSSARKRAATTNSNNNTLSSSATKSNSTQSIKRPRISNIHKSNTSFKSPSAGRAQYSSGQSPAPNNIKHEKNNGMLPGKLLLCKRWTIACSKSIHGRVNHGELLDFSENWKNNGKSTNDKTTNGLTNKKQNKQQKKVIDPMVRFRSHSGRVEGSLNKYLCSLLAPLLKIPATSNSNGGTHAIGGGINNPFIPMIYLEGEALMEDRHLVIGSEVPLSLKIYLNDPIGFFELFQFSSESGGKGGESKLFFRKDDGGKSLPWQGKSKLKNNFSEAELAQAAYHLLQWAEKGEEIVFTEVNGNAMLDNEKSEMVEKNIGTMKPMAGKKEADDDIDDASDSSATVNI